MKVLVQFVLGRPVAASIVFIAITAGGLFAGFNAPLDFLPPMETPQITVSTAFEGLPAADIRELITMPLEDALSSLTGLKRVRSWSRDGSSLIQLTLEWGTAMDAAALKAREILDTAWLTLPSQAEKPLVLPVDPGELPVLTLGVYPKPGANIGLVRELAERELRAAIQQVEGTGSIQVTGGQRELIEIQVDQSRLGRTGLALTDIVSAVGGMNAEYPSGSLDDGDVRYIIKADGRRKSWEEIGDIAIGTNEQTQAVRIRDVAYVNRDLDKRQEFLVTDGTEGVVMAIRRNRSFSPVSLSKNLHNAIPHLNNAYSKDLVIRVIDDQSKAISNGMKQLLLSGLGGCIAAFLVLLYFLRHIRYAFIAITAIPVSILGTVAVLRAMGISFNIMSLGGLTLGIGMLVDNAVVVLENLIRKVRHNNVKHIAQVTAEIANAIVGSTLTSVVVFLPLLLLPGLLGLLFSDLAWAIVLSLIFSLLVSIFWVPLLFSRPGFNGIIHSLTPDHRNGTQANSASMPLLANKQSSLYRTTLRSCLKAPAIILVPVFIIIAAGIIILPNMPFNWLQPFRQSRIDITLRQPPGTTVEHSFQTALALVAHLGNNADIQTVSATGGGSLRDPWFLSDPTRDKERTDIAVFIRDDSPWNPSVLREEVIRLLNNPANIAVEASWPPDFPSRVLGISNNRVRLLASATNPRQALETVQSLKTAAPFGNNPEVLPSNKKPQLRLKPDRQALARFGLSLTSLAQVTGTAVNGQIAGSFEEEGRRIPIRVRLQEQDRRNLADLSYLNIASTQNGPLKLHELAILRETEEFPILFREGRRDAAYLVVPEDEVSSWLLHTGNRLRDPQSEIKTEQKKAFIRLVILVAGLLYVLLGIQFNSFILPIMFLLTQPIPLVGSLLVLGLSGKGLNLNSLLGLLVVLGLSINNAILLYENYRQKRLNNWSTGWAVYGGTMERLRAILTTTCSTLAALMPLALDFSDRNPQSALALAVVGGLVVAIPVALIGLPALFAVYLKRVDNLRL